MPLFSIDALPPFVARFDRATVLAAGLFMSVDKRKRQVPDNDDSNVSALQITFKFEQLKRVVHYEGPVQLTVSDLRVLQGVMAMATAAGVARHDAGTRGDKVLEGSWQGLVRACGVRPTAGESDKPRTTSGGRSGQLQRTLQRLSSVQVTASDRAGDREPLITIDPDWNTKDGFKIGFCTELMDALGAGRNGKQYLKVNMNEVRSLQTDAARLLHFRLSNVNEGTSREFSQLEMERMIWPDEADTDAKRKHRKRLFLRAKDAVAALDGWSVILVEGSKGSWAWKVSRPKASVTSAKRKS